VVCAPRRRPDRGALAAAEIALGLSSSESSAPGNQPGAATVAAAYGYPARCLSITISTVDPAFARAEFDRANRCRRYDGYTTAIFRRVNRLWRPVLDAVLYRCLVASIPPPVQAQLGVCLG
jgi:hypothetical protein